MLDNVAYGLMVKGVGKAERERRAAEMLELVALGGLGARRPAELSGGQRQRVALARALINQPEVLLLDEPLGALDLKLRQQMQIELKALQRKVGITFVYVTHDQEEALAMSDRSRSSTTAGSSRSARPRRSTSTRRPPSSPASSAPRTSSTRRPRQRLTGARRPFSLRPEQIRIGAATPPSHGVDGTVVSVQYHGASTRIEVALDGRQVLIVDRPNDLRGAGAAGAAAAACGCLATPPCSRWTAAPRHERRATGLPLGAPACARPRAAALSTFLYRRGRPAALLLLAPPLAWLGVVYLGSLCALLIQSFFSFDDFSGQVCASSRCATYVELLTSPPISTSSCAPWRWRPR